MVDTENQDLILDQDFVADLGVPFICSNCNELFGSQEYLNQHADICYEMKHGMTTGTDSDSFQLEDFDGREQNLPSSFPRMHYTVNHNCNQNIMSMGLTDQEQNVLGNFTPNHTSSYSVSVLPQTVHQATDEFSCVSAQRNDVLLSSTTENSHPYNQLPLQSRPQVVDPHSVNAVGNGSQQSSATSQPLSCPGCHNTYLNQWFLDQHAKQCLGISKFQISNQENRCGLNEGPIPCPNCTLVYLNKFFLSQHLLACSIEPQKHSSVEVPALTLDNNFTALCSSEFSLQHSPNEEPSDQSICSTSSINTKLEHYTPPAVLATPNPCGTIEVDNSADSIHTCQQCHMDFAQKSSLQAHIRTHNGEKPFECEECGQRFVIKSNLKKHYQIHTQEKPHKCDVCGDYFALKTGLTRHLRIHTGEKPFQCLECGQRFSSRGNLKKHAPIHIGKKGFSCKVCGRRFQREDALQAHAAVHTGEKGYQCPMCETSFLHQNGLDAHFRTHTGEKPYPCGMCDLTFARRGGLKAHMRTHTGEKPYVCTSCGQAFAHKSNLNAHNRTHTGEKPFGCNYCDQKFAHKSNLKKHTNTHIDKTMLLSPAGSLSDSSCAVSDVSVASSAPMISAITKMTSVMVSPFSDDNDSKFFDFMDMLEYPPTQTLLQI